jgi:hypothetical protein
LVQNSVNFRFISFAQFFGVNLESAYRKVFAVFRLLEPRSWCPGFGRKSNRRIRGERGAPPGLRGPITMQVLYLLKNTAVSENKIPTERFFEL